MFQEIQRYTRGLRVQVMLHYLAIPLIITEQMFSLGTIIFVAYAISGFVYKEFANTFD